MTSDAALARAQRWRAFYDEPGGLAEMFGRQMAELNRAGMEAVQQCDVAMHERVMLSMKELTKLQQAIQGVLATGDLAASAVKHAQRVQELPERKRRWI